MSPTAVADPTTELASAIIGASARLVRLAGGAADVTLSIPQVRLLALIDRGSARVTELARRERCAQPTMTSLLDRLERDGYVTRTRDATDGRAVLVAVTDRGRAELDSARTSMAAAIAPTLLGLTEAQRATLRAAADILTTVTEDS